MNTITLAAALAILEDCSAVIWNDTFLTYPACADLTGEGDNQFLHVEGSDEEGQEYSATFVEENNREVRIVGSSMFLFDEDGDEVQFTVLVPAKLAE